MLRSGIVVLAAVGLLLRFYALVRGPINSDEAIVGLMAREILHGHFSAFYWGQSYGGGEPYVVALVFRAAGESPFTLGLTPVLLDALAAFLTYLIGQRLFSRRVGAIAGLLFWIWPEVFVWQSTVEYGFRFATLDLGLGGLLCALRLCGVGSTIVDDPDDATKRFLDAAAIGLFFGLGWWCSPEIAYFAIPALALILGRLVRRELRLGVGQLLAAVVAFVVGALPWIWANVRSGLSSLHSGRQPDASFIGHAKVFVAHTLPMALGVQMPGRGIWLLGSTGGAIVEAVALALALILLVHLLLERRGLVFVLWLVVFPVLYCASPFTWYWQDGRYAIYLGPLLALAAALGTTQLARGLARLLGRAGVEFAVAAVVLTVALGLTLWAAARLAPFEADHLPTTARVSWTSFQSDPNGFDVQLATDLNRIGVTDVFAGYWIANPLTFVSNDKVVATDVRNIRNHAIYNEVADSQAPAWLFLDGRHATYVRLVNLTGSSVLDPACSALNYPCVTPQSFEDELVRLHIGYRVDELTSDGFLVVRPQRKLPADVPLRDIEAIGVPPRRASGD